VKLWPHSVRWRLTLWYSLGLSAMLALCAAGSWYLLRQVMADRADQFLLEARDAFLVELSAEREALPSNAEALAAAMRDVRFSDIEFVVLDSSLRIVAASSALPQAAHARPASPMYRGDHRVLAERLDEERRAATGAPAASMLSVPGEVGGSRVALTSVTLGGAPHTVAAVQSRRWLHETMMAVTAAYVTAIPAILLLAAGGGYLLARRALQPIAAMGRRARAIEASNLHERLPVDDPRDELGELATLINDLLQRLDSAFTLQRRLVADASHELRTPVAVVRAEAEVALAKPSRPENEYRDALRVVQDAGQRLSRIVDDLFLLARADGGPVPIAREPVYLDELVADTVRVLRVLAGQRGVRIELAPLPEALVQGDPDLLGRLLLNLMENAVKFSPAGSTVSVRLDYGDAAVLSVADEGPGIPAEARARVFERFFRAHEAPSNRTGPAPRGAGLGLAIAKWVADLHGGSLVLVRSSPGGSEFQVTLPADAARAPDASAIPEGIT
jgi:heavy metal sensor kinase